MHPSNFNYHQNPRKNNLNQSNPFNSQGTGISAPQFQEQLVEGLPRPSSSFGESSCSQSFFPPTMPPPPIPLVHFLPPPNFPSETNYPPSGNLPIPPPNFPPETSYPPGGNLPIPPPNFPSDTNYPPGGSLPFPPSNQSSYSGFKVLDEPENIAQHFVESKSVSDWLQTKRIQLKTEPRKFKQKFQICVYREQLEMCALNIKKINELSEKMRENVENMNSDAWDSCQNEMLSLKRKIECNLEFLNNEEMLLLIKKQLQKRKSKRERLKRRKIELHEERIKQEHIRKIQNQEIDDWLRSQLEAADKIKRDEQLKREAESVLSEVTRKTAEANRQIELLSGLASLRTLKAQNHSKEEKSTPLKDGSYIVLENLQKMWRKKLKEYELEEHGLKVMLSEANEETIKSNKSLEKQAVTKWKQLLFGKDESHQFYGDLNELIIIRSQWDKFIVPNNSFNFGETSSFIPVGWVLPSTPSSDDWNKLIEKEAES